MGGVKKACAKVPAWMLKKLYVENVNLLTFCKYSFAPSFETKIHKMCFKYYKTIQIQYNKIEYKYESYYSGINPVEFRGHIDVLKWLLSFTDINKNVFLD